MKKITLLLVVLFLGVTFTFAQGQKRKPWHHKFDSVKFEKRHHKLDSIIKHDSAFWMNHHKDDSVKFDSIEHHRPPMDSLKHDHPKLDSSKWHFGKHHNNPWKHDSTWQKPDSTCPKPPKPDTLNIPDIKVGNIFPNPVIDKLNLEIGAAKDNIVVILDIIDQKQGILMTQNFTLKAGKQVITMDASTLVRGMYMLRITDNKFVQMRPFMKMK